MFVILTAVAYLGLRGDRGVVNQDKDVTSIKKAVPSYESQRHIPHRQSQTNAEKQVGLRCHPKGFIEFKLITL